MNADEAERCIGRAIDSCSLCLETGSEVFVSKTIDCLSKIESAFENSYHNRDGFSRLKLELEVDNLFNYCTRCRMNNRADGRKLIEKLGKLGVIRPGP